MHEKYQMKSERVEISVCGFECCMLDAKKVLSWNKLRKMKCLCMRWVFVWNPCTLKDMVQFVHEVHPVFAVILSTFAHMLSGSNDDTMPSFNLFWVQVVALSNFKVIYLKINHSMHELWQMKSERVEILVCGFECCMLDVKKVLSWNKLRKMKCLFNRWVFVWNPCTLKEMVQFVHEVHLVFAVILSTFAHMLFWSNDDTMPSFNLFWVQVVALCNFKVI